ncbi:MAG: response regulator [Algicola sp.]|nr:response regulator [Algicola sp.]
MVAIAMLEKMGVTITLAENGQQAVEKWRDSGADLILMDCNMPVMNGFEATRMIRSEEAPNQHTPIVALTANATRENAQQCTQAGMNAVATKPFSIKDLEQVLSRWLDSYYKNAGL